MGRFMLQLFGSKPEPWAADKGAAQRTNEPTQALDEDNEKTAVVDSRPDLMHRRLETERDPREDAQVDYPLETPTHQLLAPPPRPPQAPPDASAWQANTPPALRPSARFAAVSPRTGHGQERPPNVHEAATVPVARQTPAGMAAERTPPPEPVRQAPPQPTQTLAGVVPVRLSSPMQAVAPPPVSSSSPGITFHQPSPARGSEPPQQIEPLIPPGVNDELSDAGARPLVGWQGGVTSAPATPPVMAPVAPVAYEPQYDPNAIGEDYKIRSTNAWLIFAILLVLGVAAAVTVIVVAG
jgi:hypothetical protein